MGNPYFYILKHMPTGKYYAGCKINKKADVHNLMKENGYKTSSKIVKEYIKKYGLHSFIIIKTKIFNTAEETLKYETKFLAKVKADENSLFINRSINSPKFRNKGGYSLSESTKEKMRKPKSAECIRKQNIAKNARTKEVREKIWATRVKNNNHIMSESQREKIREKNIERFKDPEIRKKWSKMMTEYYEKNPVSEETKRKKKRAD